MTILDSDLDAIFADTSVTVPVQFASQSVNGFLTTEDLPEPDIAGGVTIVSRRVVTMREGVLTGLAQNLAITVDGVSYKIHGVRSGGRGKTKILIA